MQSSSSQKKFPGKFLKIGAAVIAFFFIVCCLAVFAIANSPSTTSPAPTMTQDFNAMLTQTYETAIVSIPEASQMEKLPAIPVTGGTETSTPAPTALVIFTSTPEQISAPPQPCIPNRPPQYAKVVKVVDGDTIRVLLEGVEKPVRYVGIDTPESTFQIEYFGEQASQKNKELVEGRDVVMYRDVSETDDFDRLRRYVFVGDKFINYELVSQGLANAFRYEPDTSCAELFAKAESEAKALGLGLWSASATQSALSTQSPSAGNLEIVFVDKEAEYVDIKNNSSSPVDLNGWMLVSEKGSQACDLGGIIQSGEKLRIWAGTGEGYSCNFGKNIWNNSEPDPAVLYDPQHAEISRYP